MASISLTLTSGHGEADEIGEIGEIGQATIDFFLVELNLGE